MAAVDNPVLAEQLRRLELELTDLTAADGAGATGRT
jgi:hypothetical protein